MTTVNEGTAIRLAVEPGVERVWRAIVGFDRTEIILDSDDNAFGDVDLRWDGRGWLLSMSNPARADQLLSRLHRLFSDHPGVSERVRHIFDCVVGEAA